MRVLFDQGTPVPLRRHLHPHQVDTAAEVDWSQPRQLAIGFAAAVRFLALDDDFGVRP